jgi:hypothetical protein
MTDTGMFLNVLTSLPIALLITHKSTCKSIQYNKIQYSLRIKYAENTIKYGIVNMYMKRPLTLMLEHKHCCRQY